MKSGVSVERSEPLPGVLSEMQIYRQLTAIDVEYSRAFPKATAMKKLHVKEFGSDWPRQKLLCYNLRAAIITTLGCLEVITDHKHESPDFEKALNRALNNTQLAARNVEELFQEICKADKPR